MLKFGGDDTKIGNVSVRGNIGVRWVKTDVSRPGGVQFPLYAAAAAAPAPGSDRRIRARLVTPDDHRVHERRRLTSRGRRRRHTNLLPSLNVRFGLTDDQFMRFAASRALARPDMGLYKYYYTHRSADDGDCAAGTVVWTSSGRLHQRTRWRGRRVTPATRVTRCSSRPRPTSST